MSELSPIELVALSKCVKEKEAAAARDKISDASANAVDFCVRIQGNVTRAGGTAAMTSRVEASQRPADLLRFDVCCAVLRQLGIGEKRLEAALRSVAAAPITEDSKMRSIFDQVAADCAELVPAREVVTPAKSGNVSVAVNLSKV